MSRKKSKPAGIPTRLEEVTREPILKTALRQSRILDTPGPWDRSWLDANGLQVVYAHGQAELRFKS